MNSNSPVNCFVQNHQYFEKFAKNNKFGGCPRKFYHSFMYRALSCDHSCLTLILPFNVILRGFEVVF